MQLRVLGQGVITPGMPHWDTAAPVLRGAVPYRSAPLRPPPPEGLPMNERRRAQLTTRLALEAGRQAIAGSDLSKPDRAQLQTVFASSDGDMTLIDAMCRDIYQHRTPPSPTIFQNSVHNAVAGYWAIAEECRAASTSLAAADGTVAAGLLEAVTQCIADARPVLLVAFDVPGPPLLDPYRHFDAAFACALLLGPLATGRDGADLSVAVIDAADTVPTAMDDPDLEAVRTGNPAARALPLLRAIALGGAHRLRLPYLDDLKLELRLT
jgi:hypothetical protein